MNPELESASIVILGSFNPPIFHPQWLAVHEVIATPEADAAQISINHRDISAFSLDWINLRVEPHRLVAEVSQAPWVRAKDLISKVFRDLLPHTPLHALGINRQAHYRIGSQTKLDRIAVALAPREPWGDWAEWIDTPQGKLKGGLRSMTMEMRPPPEDRNGGFLLTKIEPSVKVTPGIYLHNNDHFNTLAGEKTVNGEEVLDILDQHWQVSIDRSKKIFLNLLALK